MFHIRVEEEDDVAARSEVYTAVLNPTLAETADDPRAILRKRFEQLQDPSVALEILHCYVPPYPERVKTVCTPPNYRCRKDGRGDRYLSDACRLLIDRGYDVHLRIVGGGEMKEALRRHIAEVGLDERVELLGARPQDEVIELYRMAAVFALPCVILDNGDRDGIPNVLVEAAA
jgi:Glycosyl transferases group 1